MENYEAKRQLFYEIECVIDDCDSAAGYKPLSDSDELDEEELQEEDVPSGDEWTHEITRRSTSSTPRAKRPRLTNPSARQRARPRDPPTEPPTLPRRRGRPRKHAPKPTKHAPEPTKHAPEPTKHAQPELLSDSDEIGDSVEDSVDFGEEWKPLMKRSPSQTAYLPRTRGRPCKHASQPSSSSRPRGRPRKHATNSASIPTSKPAPNAVTTPISEPTPTPNTASSPTSKPAPNSLSTHTSEPIPNPTPTPEHTPNAASASTSISVTTPKSEATPTPISKPTHTLQEFVSDIDRDRISISVKEEKPLERRLSFDEFEPSTAQNPEYFKSPEPAAVLRRSRGRPRKHTNQPLSPSRPRGRPPKRAHKPNTNPASIPASNSPIPNVVTTPTSEATPTIIPSPTPSHTHEPVFVPKPTSEPTPIPIPNPTPKLTPTKKSTQTSHLEEQSIGRPPFSSQSPQTGKRSAPEPDQWYDITEEDEEPALPNFCPKRPPGPQLTTKTNYSPMQLFQLFFTSSAVDTIVRNTNKHAEKKAEAGRKYRWVPLTVNEFYSYIALIMYMGLVKANALKDYWSKRKLYSFSYPQSIMSRARFQTISQNLHLCDVEEEEKNMKKRGTPGFDRLMKIKPLYNDLLLACMKHFHPDRELSIDERMVTKKAKKCKKQRIQIRSATLGYKLFVLSDSCCGYAWKFFAYGGRSPEATGKGIGYDSVMSLIDTSFLGTGYKLFTGNYHTSPTLFLDLLKKNIVACGTLRQTFNLPKTEVNDVSGNTELGTTRWCRQGPVLFMKWMDMKKVVMCSTIHKAHAGETTSRIPTPAAVKNYNTSTAGVDLSVPKVWYKMFFFHFLDIALDNSFILHQQMAKAQNKTPLSQKAFRETLISELTSISKPASEEPSTHTKPQTSPPPSPAKRDRSMCYPEYFSSDATTGRKSCAMCRLSGDKVKTPICCTKCKVALCLVPSRNCFKKWHAERRTDL